MALIECGECGREVSDKAASCPGCGAPIGAQGKTVKAKRAGAGLETTGFLLIAGAVVGAIAGLDPLISFNVGLVGFVVFVIGRLR